MIPGRCIECGDGFIRQTTRQKTCDNCKSSRVHHAKRIVEFVGVDGEGVTRPDGKHEYVLLSVGDRSLYKPDGAELTWYDIIPFLWNCFLDNPEATYVGFYLGYDFTHWLKGLPENRARILLTNEGIALRKREKSGGNHVPFPVEHRGYSFDFLGLKRFRFWQNDSSLRAYICDAGSYFQTSFLNAIDPVKWPDGPVVTEDEYKEITAGKESRGSGVIEYGTPIDPELIRYNVLENRVLSRLMHKYNEGLENVGIRLKRDQWFGPGQAAQSWMNSIKAPTRSQFEETCDIQLRHRLRSTYYGGWFEIFAHGHIPGVSYSYDINSAYPDIQSQLPCAIHGTWDSGTGRPPSGKYVLAYGTVSGNNNYIGSAPHRTRTGHILRPQITKGWYWLHEIDAGFKAGVVSWFDCEKWSRYIPCDCPPPFRAERQLYLDRLRVGKNTIAGKARRLVYNSAYGKTAQSIGVAKYANPFYASLITSLCRTYILTAIGLHPHGPKDLLMVATDGVVFRHRNPRLSLSPEELGKWDETKYENLTLFMPGVYWDNTTRRKLRDGGSPTLKSRGISSSSLLAQISAIDNLFSQPFSGKGLPIIDIPIKFSLVTPKLALARGKWETCGNVSVDSVRTINADPIMKRSPGLFLEDGIVRSVCYERGHYGLETTPYNRTFGDDEIRELGTIITDDGDIDMILSGALKNED